MAPTNQVAVQHVAGVWARGVLRRQQADGVLQCDRLETAAYRVQGGFSGGPIWVPRLRVAVAMVAQYDATNVGQAGFGIPVTRLLSAFPELVPHASKPRSADQDLIALMRAAEDRIRLLFEEEATAIANKPEFRNVAPVLLSVAKGGHARIGSLTAENWPGRSANSGSKCVVRSRPSTTESLI